MQSWSRTLAYWILRSCVTKYGTCSRQVDNHSRWIQAAKRSTPWSHLFCFKFKGRCHGLLGSSFGIVIILQQTWIDLYQIFSFFQFFLFLFFLFFQKPDWVNAEMRFTLSGDSSLSSESSQSSENDQPKFSEIPIPEYIKETAFRGMLKCWKII